MNPIVMALNIGIVIYTFGLLYGIIYRRVFFVRWYCYEENRKKYWEVILSYVIMVAGLIFLRRLLLTQL
jgi:hypothetical protein